MQQLMARGVRIGLVSGRDILSAGAVHRLFALNGPIIAENGAEMIFHPEKDERSARVCGGLSSSDVAALVRKIAERGLFESLSIDQGKRRMLTLYPRRFSRHEPRELPALSQRVAAALEGSLSDLEITYSSAAIDICARGTNKATGIALTCKSLRTAPAAVAFAGDSNNDQAAFDFVRRSGGWVAFVGTDQTVKRSLQDYPRIYLARQRASQGTAEFMQFLLDHESLLRHSKK